jgi:hypothetical protein
MADNRPAFEGDAAGMEGEAFLLKAATINLAYAMRHGYDFVRMRVPTQLPGDR